MRRIVLYSLVFLVMSFTGVAEARLCNMGAENFYRSYGRLLSSGYEYTELENYISVDGDDVYSFDVRNKDEGKSQTNIRAYVDSDGYIEYIFMDVNFADSDVADVAVIKECCLRVIDLSSSEITWLSQHVETKRVALNLSIKQGMVYSRKNERHIYIREVPLGGGLVFIYIDGRSFEEFFDKNIKPCIIS